MQQTSFYEFGVVVHAYCRDVYAKYINGNKSDDWTLFHSLTCTSKVRITLLFIIMEFGEHTWSGFRAVEGSPACPAMAGPVFGKVESQNSCKMDIFGPGSIIPTKNRMIPW